MNFTAETTEVDFKEKLEIVKPISWLKSVSAFANGIGGVLYFGINDKTQKIVGLDDPQFVTEKISEIIKAKISPIPKITLTHLKEDNNNIIKLEIFSGLNTPYYYKTKEHTEAFVRIGNQSVTAPEYILNELILKGTGNSFDTIVSNIKIKDLSFTLLKATYKDKTHIDLEDTDFESFGLAKDNMATNAGLLLADKCPLLQSRIFCTRWNGIDMTTINDETVDDKEFGGNILQLLQNGLDFIKLHNKRSWYKTGRGRIEKIDYHETAIYELLVNSLIHRSYMDLGSEVHIDIFNDRLEITSPR
jgi:ATP-dependent DNA helicase RecG